MILKAKTKSMKVFQIVSDLLDMLKINSRLVKHMHYEIDIVE